jgi:hypothetical protein
MKNVVQVESRGREQPHVTMMRCRFCSVLRPKSTLKDGQASSVSKHSSQLNADLLFCRTVILLFIYNIFNVINMRPAYIHTIKRGKPSKIKENNKNSHISKFTVNLYYFKKSYIPA